MPHARIGSIRAAVAIVALVGLVAAAPAAGATQRAWRVHSAGTFAYEDGSSVTYLWDEGELTAVSDASISIERADGVVLIIAASDATTCVRVDGLEAHLINLVVGQRAAVVSDATGAQALAIHVGRPHRDTDEEGCGLLRGAVHGDITDQLSDGTTRQRSWDRGRITLLAAHRIRIERADGVSVTSIRTRATHVVNAPGYRRLRLGEPVTVVSLVATDPQGQAKLFALRIRAHRG
jgi:hypothetical protein